MDLQLFTAATPRRARRLRAIRSMAAAMLLACVSTGAFAQSGATETAVKAAYVHKFLPFVEWPESALPAAGAPLVVGVVNAEPVRLELEKFSVGRQVHGRVVETRRVSDGDSLDGIHVLYLGRPSSLPAWLKHLKQRAVLVVSEGSATIDAGGMLSLVVVDGRMRFEASSLAAERVGLKLSARMLALADRVVTR